MDTEKGRSHKSSVSSREIGMGSFPEGGFETSRFPGNLCRDPWIFCILAWISVVLISIIPP